MRLASFVHAMRDPHWAWRRLLERTLPRESVLRWRGFGSLDDCRRTLTTVAGENKTPVFVFPLPTVAWSYLFQRPQQMARALARTGWTVFYAADPETTGRPDSSVRGLRQIEPRLYLYSDGRDGRMISSLPRPAVVWCYWPHHAAFLEHIPHDSRILYDCLDELDVFAQYPDIRRDHESLLRRAEIVLASGTKLLNAVRPARADVRLCPNACAYEDFADPAPCRIAGLASLRRRSRVLIGYYGALAEWIDWDLLRSVARKRRDWSFLMVGDDWSGVFRSEGMHREPNVHAWKRLPYERLGRLLSQFDAAIVPFRVNEITQAVSPIKLFEYMAGGKPIVSTPLQECRKYPPVRLAATPEEFVEQIEWCLCEGRSDRHRAELQACARTQTWEARVGDVLLALGLSQ